MSFTQGIFKLQTDPEFIRKINAQLHLAWTPIYRNWYGGDT